MRILLHVYNTTYNNTLYKKVEFGYKLIGNLNQFPFTVELSQDLHNRKLTDKLAKFYSRHVKKIQKMTTYRQCFFVNGWLLKCV